MAGRRKASAPWQEKLGTKEQRVTLAPRGSLNAQPSGGAPAKARRARSASRALSKGPRTRPAATSAFDASMSFRMRLGRIAGNSSLTLSIASFRKLAPAFASAFAVA
jgi:hypothetical protein